MSAKTPMSEMRAMPSTEQEHLPYIAKPIPFLTKVNFALRTWSIKIFVVVALRLLRLFKPSKFRPLAPTYIKYYPVRPTLENRVFVPKNYAAGTKLPLFINIHGGGFVIGDPAMDDHFCRHFADEFGYCVVSINYRKAPIYPFPIPGQDCTALARAVLDDDDLPIDRNRVVLGGFSAGGNLSLVVAQEEDLKHRISAVVPIYPVTDFTQKYRGPYKVTKDGREDMLKGMSKFFNWAYVPVGLDRRTPLLSCVYAPRNRIPQKMYVVGAEYDCLCNEAEVMAKRLAGIPEATACGPTWNKNGIWWEMVPDVQHGFTHVERGGKEEIERKQICNELYKRIDSWIKQEGFSR